MEKQGAERGVQSGTFSVGKEEGKERSCVWGKPARIMALESEDGGGGQG
jgi:hypothetical protein